MARLPIEFRPAALDEAAAAQAWYTAGRPTTGARFGAELVRAIDRIENEPERWPPFLHGTRRYRLKRFPYLVVYRICPDRIEVLAIAHTSRRPGYWRRR
jgi:toxin ParE1/3/4